MRTMFIRGIRRIGITLPKSLNITSEFQEKLLQPNVYEVDLRENLSISEALKMVNRTNDARRKCDIIMHGFRIIQQDDTKNIFEHTANSVGVALQNTQTRWRFRDGILDGGAVGIKVHGSYQLIAEEMCFDYQKEWGIDTVLGLQAKISDNFFRCNKGSIRIHTDIPNGNGANAQGNMSSLHRNHITARVGSDVLIDIESSSNIDVGWTIFEGAGNPQHLVKWHGASSHARILNIHDIHIECTPIGACFHTALKANTIIERVHTQSTEAIHFLHTDNDFCKVRLRDIATLPTGSFVTVAPKSEIVVEDCGIDLYRPEFFKRVGSEEFGFPQHYEFVREYRRGATNQSSGSEEADTTFNPLSYDVLIEGEEVSGYSNNGGSFTIIGAYQSVQEWQEIKGTLISFGRFAANHTGIEINTILNRPQTIASLHLKIVQNVDGKVATYNSRYDQNKSSFATALPLHEKFTFRITFDGAKYICSQLGGNKVIYDEGVLIPSEDNPTHNLAQNKLLMPGFENGRYPTQATSKLALYDRELTENEVIAAMEYWDNQ